MKEWPYLLLAPHSPYNLLFDRNRANGSLRRGWLRGATRDVLLWASLLLLTFLEADFDSPCNSLSFSNYFPTFAFSRLQHNCYPTKRPIPRWP